MNRNDYIFLLGGHDLEMVTIKALLFRHGYEENKSVFDKGLGWDNAEWRAYKHEIQKAGDRNVSIVGIELRETPDFKKEDSWIDIDHHNERSGEPSSIEQVAALVGISLTREQLLIAANDKGYKQGMRDLGATEEEIARIRGLDRKAQGVTEQDERLAEESANNKTIERGVTVVRSLTQKFSAVTDRLDADKILVYDDKRLCYYGLNKQNLIKPFAEELENGTAYHGGGDNGFFGVARGRFDAEQIIKLKQRIINVISTAHSTHAFMMPLKWDYFSHCDQDNPMEKLGFDDRTDLKQFHKTIGQNKEKYLWERKFFRIDSPSDYNEYVYFHGHVRKALYDAQTPNEVSNEQGTKDEDIVDDGKILVYYQWKLNDNDTYEIHTVGKSYTLRLTGISLHVFNTGVLILTYNCENYEYPEKESILAINEFGRRFYPQFLAENKNGNLTSDAKHAFLASKIALRINGREIIEDFKVYASLENLKTPGRYGSEAFGYHAVIHPPEFLTNLFPNDFFIYKGEIEIKNKIRLSRVTDDRMFFQCWYGNNDTADILKISCHATDHYEYAWTYSDWWYKFMFGDAKDPSVANKNMMHEHLNNHTYARWADYGTLYGFTRDSFVGLSSDLKTLQENNAPDLSVHMKTMYYQLAVLCLAQRSSVLRFTAEVSNLTDLAKHEKVGNDIASKINNLYLNYIEFINKMYFREVTSQIQGIEMYCQFQKIMNIHEDVKSLDQEIDELYRFANTLEQEQQSKEAATLNRIATMFLPATFLAGLLALLSDKPLIWNGNLNGMWAFATIIYMLIVGITLYYSQPITNYLSKKLFATEKKTKHVRNNI